MNIKKGMPGYIRSQKKKRILITIFLFGISIAIFLTGYLTTHTRNNLLTIVAVLGCLPAARSAVGMILLLPYRSFNQEKVREIESAAPQSCVIYDLVLTSSEKVMPVDVILVSRHLVCGYASRSKPALSEIESYLHQIFKNSHYDKVTVKIFSDYNLFLKRAAEIGEMQKKENDHQQRTAQEMSKLILTAAV